MENQDQKFFRTLSQVKEQVFKLLQENFAPRDEASDELFLAEQMIGCSLLGSGLSKRPLEERDQLLNLALKVIQAHCSLRIPGLPLALSKV